MQRPLARPRVITDAAKQIEQIRLDEGSPLQRVLEDLAELWGARTLTYRARPSDGALFAIESLNSSGWIDTSVFAAELKEFLARAAEPFPAYDPIRPSADQRNVVRTFRTDTYEGHELGLFNRRVGLAEGEQMRVLVCQGPLLLAWVGACRSEPFSETEQASLAQLIPSFERRFALDRQLGASAHSSTLLAAALDELSTPAFLVQVRHARIELANRLGCELLHRRRFELFGAIRTALSGGPSEFRVVTVVGNGIAEHALLIFDPEQAPKGETGHRLAAAVAEFRLTRRQAQFVAEVVAGQPNKVIAERLGCSVRNVEAHLSVLFKRMKVDSRTALVARVLGASGH